RAARYGLSVSDIQDTIETALGGKTATTIWEGEQRFGIVVRLPPQARSDVSSIRHLLIDTPDESYVSLEQVADITSRNGAMNVSREAGRRVMAVGVFIRDRDMGSVVKDMKERVSQSVTLSPGTLIVWGGEFENQERAMARLRVIVPISVFVIFV